MIIMIVGDYMTRYIGANYVHGAYYGGVDSTFSGVFNDEQVLIGSGLDFIPCVIGDISDIYFLFGGNVAERQPQSFEDYCVCIMKTIQDYFGDYSNVDERMDNYPDLDYIADGQPIGKVSNLCGKNSAMCVERAMVAQNLLKLLGINSHYKCSGIVKNDKKEVHSYNLIEHQGKYYIFDATMPTLINEEISPLVAEVPKEVYDELVQIRTSDGISAEVSHYNPLRSEDITVVYDAGRKRSYNASKKQIIQKK